MGSSFRKIYYKFPTWIRFLMKSSQKWQKNEKYGIGPHMKNCHTKGIESTVFKLFSNNKEIHMYS